MDELPALEPRCLAPLSAVRFRPLTVERHLQQLDCSKATGPDAIPARVLKACARSLSYPLSRLFSLCFCKQVQHSLWKVANVTPVHKKQSRTIVKNYRPVSLLSIISKVMEKIVNRCIINHLEKESAISAHQFGFRQGLSTADLLTTLHHNWVSGLNQGGAVRVLAVDIAGAFDKVSHSGLLHKVQSYGICGPLLGWLKSYLTGRQLQAVVGGASPATYPVKAGVPQGSILGPTLFLLYVNDACDALPEGVIPAVYADDTTLYTHLPSLDSVQSACSKLQAGVDSLAQWGHQWRVSFEPSKSQAMTITRHRKPWHIPSVSFQGTEVAECSRMKLLGVTFDDRLSYGDHIRTVATRSAQRIGFLRKACPVLDPPGRLATYRGFVRPTMEYCPLVWMWAADTHLARLDRVQHHALKLISRGTAIDSLAVRRSVAGPTLLYKLHYKLSPPALLSLLPSPAPEPRLPRTRQDISYSSKHRYQLSSSLPVHSCNSALRSFPSCLVSQWDNLPPALLPIHPMERGLQTFKVNVYRNLKRSSWSWATDYISCS